MPTIRCATYSHRPLTRKGCSVTIARTAMIVLLAMFSVSSFGDELSHEKRADIEKLLEMTGALAIGKQMGVAVAGQIAQVLRKARPDIPERVLSALPEVVDGVISENLVQLKEVVIPIYEKHFTGDEIKELIRFYSTPLGQKAIREMPVLMSESMQAGQEWGKSLGPTIDSRIRARIDAEGYKL